MTSHCPKIAIISAALRFPGARDLEEFWANILMGKSSIARLAHDPHNPDYVPVHGVVDGYDTFDAELFGYSPREAQLTDPQQRKFLECAYEALERASYPYEPEGQSFGVIAGVGNNSYYLNNVLSHVAVREEWGETAMFVTSEKDHVATRVAHQLNLTGPAMAVQTSCSTSLVAVHLACRALQSGDADLMLAGGSTIQVPHERGYLHSPHSITSRDGECRPFDIDASGTVLGSGTGVVVLKRVEDALAAGDPILGVIAGSAVNNDGSRKVGYTAPSVAGQAEAIRRALREAGVAAAQVGYVETHGTGTELGDAIEFEALRTVLGSGASGPCFLGTLKPQIGHLDSAAGVAGLIKAMLVVQAGVIPPNVNFSRPHPQLAMEQTRFELHTACENWPNEYGTRIAGVSSFGLGGTNAHVVLEQPPRPKALGAGCSDGTGPVILPVSGQTAEAAQRLLDSLPATLDKLGADAATLSAAANTLQRGRRELPFRAALVGMDRADLIFHSRTAVPRRTLRSPRLGFMFTGFGGQWPGMCTGLADSYPLFDEALTEALHALRKAGVVLSENLESLRPDDWWSIDRGQSLQFAAQYALGRLIEAVAGSPELVLGHSLGEYAAACVCGGLDVLGAAELVAARSEALMLAAGGGMTSVLASEEEVTDILGPELVVAARNAPGTVVVSGATEALAEFESRSRDRGFKVRRLDIDVAAHSPHLDPYLEAFRERAGSVVVAPLKQPLVSTLNGRTYRKGDVLDADYWTDHLRGAVEFSRAVNEVGKARGVVLVEIGPGQPLSGLIQKISTRRPLLTVPTLPGPGEELTPREALAQTWARLWTAGMAVRWEHTRKPRSGHPVHAEMPTYPFGHDRHWLEPAGETLSPPAAGATGRTVGEKSAKDSQAPSDREVNALGDVGEVIGQLWAGLLGTEVPSARANFFAVGGDSLLLVRLIGQIQHELGARIPLRDASANPTLEGLATLTTHVRRRSERP
ncbi:type I polyketide synthase [Streptomyces rochei]|uniref:type I polyketide synthase n=1 Tax=Streptomyces rochei TaxID=1928 RepID=UPI003681D39C